MRDAHQLRTLDLGGISLEHVDYAVVEVGDDAADLKAPERAPATVELREEGAVVDLTAQGSANPYTAGYFRTEADCRRLEQRIIDRVDGGWIGSSGLVFVVVDGMSPLADLTRTREMQLGWADLPTYMDGYEEATLNMSLIDFHCEERPRIVQSIRAVCGALTPPQSSGSQVVDSLADRITPEEVCADLGIASLRECWDITTLYNVRRVRKPRRLPLGYSLMTYFGSVRHMIALDVPNVISYVNDATKQSFRRMGIQHRPMLGRELVAPLVDGYEYNSAFVAIVQSTRDLATQLFSPEYAFSELIAPFRAMEIPMVMIRSARPAATATT